MENLSKGCHGKSMFFLEKTDKLNIVRLTCLLYTQRIILPPGIWNRQNAEYLLRYHMPLSVENIYVHISGEHLWTQFYMPILYISLDQAIMWNMQILTLWSNAAISRLLGHSVKVILQINPYTGLYTLKIRSLSSPTMMAYW